MKDNSGGFRVVQTAEFATWLDTLRDPIAQARIASRIRRAELGNLGDWKQLGGRIAELRIGHGPGYRVYFAWHGGQLVLLLAGGDKSSQRRDIATARALLDRIGDLA
jgi:putative addiction module killer protein